MFRRQLEILERRKWLGLWKHPFVSGCLGFQVLRVQLLSLPLRNPLREVRGHTNGIHETYDAQRRICPCPSSLVQPVLHVESGNSSA